MLGACSGGADSLALVLALDEMRRHGLADLVVAHVHHGLRGAEADAEAARARAAAAHLGVPFVERRVDAAATAAVRRRGLEEGARVARRQALEELRAQARCDLVALAHTADDQAETVLLRLFRGAGAEGLGGMPSRLGHVIRPLLRLRREEVRAAVHSAGLAWTSDPTNWSPTSARSQVRELLERLEAVLDPGLVERLCETADQLREESAWLDEMAAALLMPRLSRERGVEGLPRVRVSDVAGLQDAPAPLRRRAVRRLLRELRPHAPPPSADAVRRASRLFAAPPTPRSALLSGTVLHRAGPDVVAGPEPPARGPAGTVALPVGGFVRWGSGHLTLRPAEAEPPEADAARVLVDADAVAAGLVVRGRRPGDRLGAGPRSRRVSDVLAARGVPAAWRDAHPLVCLGPEGTTIVWVPAQDADPRFLAGRDSTNALELAWRPTAPEAGAPA